MTLKESKKNVKKIIKIHEKTEDIIKEIEIVNINRILSNEPEIIITRFELMEID